MQQDNNIQNKLQQLENQQLPDLSHMDEHWQQMQAMLQTPGSTGGNLINMNRWLWIMAGIVFVAAAIFITNHFVNKKNDEKLTTETIQQNKNQGEKIQDGKLIPANVSSTASNDSISKNSLATKKIIAAIKKASIIKITKQPVVPEDINLPEKLDSNTSALKTMEPDKQLLLNNLLTELTKKAQEFIIDNRRDTLLTAVEGSSLFIPANSLGGSNEVKISLKEYYKTSDIILNKLSTTSNGNQLVTGGMVNITATVNGQPVSLQPNKPIRLYLPDTSSERMKGMQLFVGEEKGTVQKQNRNQQDIPATTAMQVNWIPRNQYFSRLRTVTEARVFNIPNRPFEIIESKKGNIGYFDIADDSKLSRTELRSILKKKYGYFKVHVQHSWKSHIAHTKGNDVITYPDDAFDVNGLGDSIWMDKTLAEKYKLQSTATRTYQIKELQTSDNGGVEKLLDYVQRNKHVNGVTKQDVFEKLKDKYYIDINSLGWINCDHFLSRTKLVEYAVNLNDSAANYYTMLVFTNIKSMMSGYLSGNKVTFENVPEGEPVKIVSIGINKNGQPIMAIKETTIHKEEETGLQFEQVAAGNIKSSLSKMDTAP